jgi:endonuclease/exonuclease/phosphatase family metal-dependent hydrolase
VFRVGSYNVRSLRDDTGALVAVIRAMRPDVLCLQEAPRFLRWRHKRRELARRAGLTVAAGGRIGGVAVLAGPDVRVLHAEAHRLRWFSGLEWRVVAIAVVEKDGVRLVVASVHLDLVAGARLFHAAQILPLVERTAKDFQAEVVLAGDLNERPGGPVWRYFGERCADGYVCAPRGVGDTFPARAPDRRIDAVFVSKGLAVVSCGAVDAEPADLAAASDHVPVVADLA